MTTSDRASKCKKKKQETGGENVLKTAFKHKVKIKSLTSTLKRNKKNLHMNLVFIFSVRYSPAMAKEKGFCL